MLDVAQAGRFASQTEFRGLTGTMVRAGMEGVRGFTRESSAARSTASKVASVAGGCDCDGLASVEADLAWYEEQLLGECRSRDGVAYNETGDVRWSVVAGEPDDEGCRTCSLQGAVDMQIDDTELSGELPAYTCTHTLATYTCCNPWTDMLADDLEEDPSGENAFESGPVTEYSGPGECYPIKSRKRDGCGVYPYSYGRGGESDCGCVADSPAWVGLNPIQIGFLRTWVKEGWGAGDLTNNESIDAGGWEFMMGLVYPDSDPKDYVWGCDGGIGDITTDQAKAVYRKALMIAWSKVLSNADLVVAAVCQVLGPGSAQTAEEWFARGTPLRVYVASNPPTLDPEETLAQVFQEHGVIFVNCDGNGGLKRFVVGAGGDPERVESMMLSKCWMALWVSTLVHELVHVLFGLPDNFGGKAERCKEAHRAEQLFGLLMTQRSSNWAGVCSLSYLL